MKIHTWEKVVTEVLEESPLARSDDYVLMYLVCEKINNRLLDLPFGRVIFHHEAMRMPSWETITRVRRKIQKNRPDLVDKEAAKKRHKQEVVYREYAKS